MTNVTSPAHAPWGYEYLPTQEAANSIWRWQIAQCLILGGYTWDIILSFVGDCEFVFCRRFNYVTCLYVINRIAATLCLTGYFVVTITAIHGCEAVNVMIPISEGITLFTSCALLVVRVWVVYREQTYVIIFMIAFLFPGPIINIIAWAPLRASILPNTSGCSVSRQPPSWGYLPFLFQAAFDVSVFVLCLIKLLTKSDLSFQNIRHHPTGTTMKIRREFIKGGFLYYIPNVIIQIITLIFLGQKDHALRYITTPCATAVASAQSLRITRKLWKLAVSGRQDLDIVALQNMDEEMEVGKPQNDDTL